jgi:hypothetical protein
MQLRTSCFVRTDGAVIAGAPQVCERIWEGNIWNNKLVSSKQAVRLTIDIPGPLQRHKLILKALMPENWLRNRRECDLLADLYSAVESRLYDLRLPDIPFYTTCRVEQRKLTRREGHAVRDLILSPPRLLTLNNKVRRLLQTYCCSGPGLTFQQRRGRRLIRKYPLISEKINFHLQNYIMLNVIFVSEIFCLMPCCIFFVIL